MGVSMAFAKQLLIVSLSGLAVSIAVVMLILPSTNRRGFEQDALQCFKSMEQCLATRLSVMQDILPGASAAAVVGSHNRTKAVSMHKNPGLETATTVTNLLACVGKMQTDLEYARREVVIGMLDTDDLSQIQGLFLGILPPVLGLMAGVDFVRKQFSKSVWEFHGGSIGTEHQHALDAHGLFSEAMGVALKKLKITPTKSTEALSPSRLLDGDVETGKGHASNDISIAGLERRLQAMRASREPRTQKWIDDLRSLENVKEREVERSLLFIMLNVMIIFKLLFLRG